MCNCQLLVLIEIRFKTRKLCVNFITETTGNSLFRLTSLIYTEKFEFENPAIMEDKQCKQTERFSVTGKASNYFLLLDDKSKQRYKIETNNKQGYYQIKQEELSGDICKRRKV